MLHLPDSFLTLFPILFLIVGAVVNILFAVAVFKDAAKLSLHEPYRGTLFVGAFIWTLAVLFGGPLVAGMYWILNRSTLRAVAPPKSPL